jgi:hypothetical protein
MNSVESHSLCQALYVLAVCSCCVYCYALLGVTLACAHELCSDSKDDTTSFTLARAKASSAKQTIVSAAAAAAVMAASMYKVS